MFRGKDLLSVKEQRLFHPSRIRNLINRQQQFSYRYVRLNVTSCTRIFSPVKALQFARVNLGRSGPIVGCYHTSLTIPIPSPQPCVGTRFDRAKRLIERITFSHPFDFYPFFVDRRLSRASAR